MLTSGGGGGVGVHERPGSCQSMLIATRTTVLLFVIGHVCVGCFRCGVVLSTRREEEVKEGHTAQTTIHIVDRDRGWPGHFFMIPLRFPLFFIFYVHSLKIYVMVECSRLLVQRSFQLEWGVGKEGGVGGGRYHLVPLSV